MSYDQEYRYSMSSEEWEEYYNNQIQKQMKNKDKGFRYKYDIYSERNKKVEPWTGVFQNKEESDKWYFEHGKAFEKQGKILIGMERNANKRYSKWHCFYETSAGYVFDDEN